jgi:hypothetical protein
MEISKKKIKNIYIIYIYMLYSLCSSTLYQRSKSLNILFLLFFQYIMFFSRAYNSIIFFISDSYVISVLNVFQMYVDMYFE